MAGIGEKQLRLTGLLKCVQNRVHAHLSWNEVWTVCLQEKFVEWHMLDEVTHSSCTTIALRYQRSNSNIGIWKFLQPLLPVLPVAREAVTVNAVIVR